MLRSEAEQALFAFASAARELATTTKTPAHFELRIRPHMDTVLDALGVEVEYECDLCQDVGYTTIPAHQSGGNIVDERQIPCVCRKAGAYAHIDTKDTEL